MPFAQVSRLHRATLFFQAYSFLSNYLSGMDLVTLTKNKHVKKYYCNFKYHFYFSYEL